MDILKKKNNNNTMTTTTKKSSYQNRVKDIEDGKVKLQKQCYITGGGMSLLAEKNMGKIVAENRVEKLMRIILKSNDYDMIAEALEGQNIPVKYHAVLGERENKKGDLKPCYFSLWGKYAGAFYKDKPPPILNYYIPFEKDEFIFHKDNEGYNKFEPKDKTFIHKDGDEHKIIW